MYFYYNKNARNSQTWPADPYCIRTWINGNMQNSKFDICKSTHLSKLKNVDSQVRFHVKKKIFSIFFLSMLTNIGLSIWCKLVIHRGLLCVWKRIPFGHRPSNKRPWISMFRMLYFDLQIVIKGTRITYSKFWSEFQIHNKISQLFIPKNKLYRNI